MLCASVRSRNINKPKDYKPLMEIKLNLTNLLTSLRGLLTIPLSYYILQQENTLALAVFILAIITELDGTVARKFHQETAFGAIYDPLVDAVFFLGGVIALIVMSKLSLFFMILLVTANIPRLVFMYLFYKKRGKFKSTKWTKFSGLLGTMIIPLAIFNFQYLNKYIVILTFFTLLLMVGVGREYFARRKGRTRV